MDFICRVIFLGDGYGSTVIRWDEIEDKIRLKLMLSPKLDKLVREDKDYKIEDAERDIKDGSVTKEYNREYLMCDSKNNKLAVFSCDFNNNNSNIKDIMIRELQEQIKVQKVWVHIYKKHSNLSIKEQRTLAKYPYESLMRYLQYAKVFEKPSQEGEVMPEEAEE